MCSEKRHNHTWIKAEVLALPHFSGFRIAVRISAYADQVSRHLQYVQKSENLYHCVFMGQSGMWLPALRSHLPLQHLAALSKTDVLEAVELPNLLM